MWRRELYPVRRRPDWLGRYSEEFRRRIDVPFEWGVHDCATAVLGMVEAMTGQKLVPELEHKTEAQARRILRRRRGLRRIAREIAKQYSFAAIDPRQAIRGDVLVVQGKNRERVLGIVGPRVDSFVVATDPGWRIYSLEKAIARSMILNCFRIPS